MKTLVLTVAVLFAGCTNAPNATKVLEENGFTNVRMTGYAWFACSKDDTYHTGFIATSPNGREVEGTVCEGLVFKNSTIRFN